MRRLACLLSLMLCGCVVSVQPVVPAATSTFDTRLLGTWGEADGKTRVVISRGDSNTYELAYTDGDGKVGSFEARLGKVGTRTVLDVQPAPRESHPMPEAASLIRGHMLYVLSIAPDSVLVSMLNRKTLREAMKSKSVALAGFDDGDQVVLTGTTAELNRAMAGYLDRPRALDEASTWRRVVRP
jgi:hypothetical protein